MASDTDFADRVLAIFDSWNQGDFDGWAALAHPDVEFCPEMVGQLEGRVYQGRAGLRRFWDEWHDVWDTVTVRVEEHEWRGERLLVLGGVSARGRHSGVAVNSPLAWVFEFAGTEIRRVRSYQNAEAARGAARGSDPRAASKRDKCPGGPRG
jgi:ketosteroid isomerase-like protein